MPHTTDKLHRILRGTRIEFGSHTAGRHTIFYFWLDGYQIGNPVKGLLQAETVAYALAGLSDYIKYM